MIELPASIGQRLLWLLDHYRGADGALNCPILCRLRGRLDLEALPAAIAAVERRHEILRTTLERRLRALVQVIHPVGRAVVELVSVAGAEHLAGAIAAEQARRIDTAEWPVRVTLWRVAPDDHVLCVNMHHLVTDAWSCGVIFRDLSIQYRRAIGDAVESPGPAWQYRDFTAWQLAAAGSDAWHEHRVYWMRQLAGAHPVPVPLPKALPGVARKTAAVACDLDASVVDRLRATGRSMHSSLFNLALASCYAWLHRATGEVDLAVASVFANRDRTEVQQTVGFIANLVVLRVRVPRRATFRDLVRESHATVLGALLHQALPLQLLPTQTMSERPDVVFQMLPEVVPVTGRWSDELQVEALVPEGVGSRFALELALVPRGRGFRAVLFHDRNRLDRARAEHVLGWYTAVAAAVAADPDVELVGLGGPW